MMFINFVKAVLVFLAIMFTICIAGTKANTNEVMLREYIKYMLATLSCLFIALFLNIVF